MKQDINKEIHYFEQRNPEKIYISKAFSYFEYKGMFTNEKRFIKKVFDKSTTTEFFEVEGELLLKDLKLFKKRYQISAIVYSKADTNLMEFTIQRFIVNEEGKTIPRDVSFSFSQEEFTSLLKFLSDVKFIDFSDKERFVIEANSIQSSKILLNLSQPDPNKLLVDKELADLVSQLSNLKNEQRETLLESLRSNVLTKSDLDILTGRKDGLEEFKEYLKLEKDINEMKWQEFFKNNSWIFGYGLDYRFLNILQKEASVSSTDLDGKNEVKLDFLLADKNFTILVELKRPTTPLFEKEKNRSESWRLSKDLTYAVSQILSQKAEWELNAQHKNFDDRGESINQITADPKTILIIGDCNQFMGATKEDLIKKRTFELYRRNLRNIEIFTFDELLERAKFIVNDRVDIKVVDSESEYDDLPF